MRVNVIASIVRNQFLLFYVHYIYDNNSPDNQRLHNNAPIGPYFDSPVPTLFVFVLDHFPEFT